MGDTRQDILDASLVLFAERGYDKTSLREIAEQVGVTKAALYYHFPSKEEILVALLEPLVQMQNALVAELRGGSLTDSSTWASSIERLLDVVLANRPLVNLIDRNASAVMTLAHKGPFAESHLEMHRLTEALFANEEIPLADRIRLACALGAVMGVIEVGGSSPFGGTPNEELQPVVIDVVRSILAPVSVPVRS